MAIKHITEAQLDSLIENLDRYVCKGFSHNTDRDPSDWDSLHFEYTGPPELGSNFYLHHPYSKALGDINYDVVDMIFLTTYPFPRRDTFHITSQPQVIAIKKAVMPLYNHYREYGNAVQQPHKVYG